VIELYQGDCLDVLKTLPTGSVSAVVTDPPYSSGGMFRADRNASTKTKYGEGLPGARSYPEFTGDCRDQRSYLIWANFWLSECLRIAAPGAPVLLFTDWRQLPTMTDAIQVGGWVWRGIAVWDKTEAARPDRGRFRHQCEYVLWGSKGSMGRRSDAACLPGLFRHPVRASDKFHQTGKPTVLMEDLLKIVPAGVVLDPFMGSGSTGVAALRRDLGFVGIEAGAEYFAIAQERLAPWLRDRAA
jgi:site-specific DNA-methyltransferase (adenine-specific)